MGKGNGTRKRSQRARLDSPLTGRMRTKGYLMCTEVAEKVGVHKATLYKWIKDNRVEAVDFNGAYYVKWASVVEHLGEVADVLGITGEIPAE